MQLEEKLIADTDDDGGPPIEFLQALVGRFEDEPEIEAAFSVAIQRLSENLSMIDLTGNYKPYLVVSPPTVQCICAPMLSNDIRHFRE